jgi:hypothetical protein
MYAEYQKWAVVIQGGAREMEDGIRGLRKRTSSL